MTCFYNALKRLSFKDILWTTELIAIHTMKRIQSFIKTIYRFINFHLTL